MTKRCVASALSAPSLIGVVETGLCGACQRPRAWAALMCEASGDVVLL